MAPVVGRVLGGDVDVPEGDAVELALAIAAEAGRLVRRDAAEHIAALKLLVADYIGQRASPPIVDWKFIAQRNMQKVEVWRAEDRARHAQALARLKATGYVVAPKAPRK